MAYINNYKMQYSYHTTYSNFSHFCIQVHGVKIYYMEIFRLTMAAILLYTWTVVEIRLLFS